MATNEDVHAELVNAERKGVEVVQQDENTVVVQAKAAKVEFTKEFGRFKTAAVDGVSTTFDKAVAAVRAEVQRVEQAASDAVKTVTGRKKAAKPAAPEADAMVAEGAPVSEKDA